MRRVFLLIVLAVLVNFPWAHELWVGLRLDQAGRSVTMQVVGHNTVEGRYFIRYQVSGTKEIYSARVDGSTYAEATQAGRVRGRVMPGSSAENRVDGQITGHGFVVLALVSDLFLLLAALALWLRRRDAGLRVVSIASDLMIIEFGGREVAVRARPETLARARPGKPTHARLTLLAHTDLVPCEGPDGLSALPGEATGYRLCGRVVDVAAGWLVIESAPGVRMRVRMGDHRARADLRELAEVSGELWLAR